MPRLRVPFKALIATLGVAFGLGPASAAQAQNLVLDEEFNQFCHQLTAPLRPQLVPGRTIHFVLVNDPAINAFVTPENLVFVHSGLVMQAKSAAELQGVLAHELAHLAAGHLQQKQAQTASALVPVLAGAALGIGAAVAGAPQAAVALTMGGQAAGIQTLLNYSRMQEQEADQRALTALHGAGFSAKGMVGMFNTLRTQGQLSYDAPPPWLLTHPLPAERLARLQAAAEAEKSAPSPLTAEAQWPRVQAKVAALTLSPPATLRRYTTSTPPERMARAIALMRQGKLAESNTELAPLLLAKPTDAYAQELAGQIALQQGQLAAATPHFKAALQSQPQGLLLRYQLAEALRAQGQNAEALAHYKEITRRWPIWSEPWEGLGRTLGQQGDITGSHLAFAEAALADGDTPTAKQSLALAQQYLKAKPTPENTSWVNTLKEQLQVKE